MAYGRKVKIKNGSFNLNFRKTLTGKFTIFSAVFLVITITVLSVLLDTTQEKSLREHLINDAELFLNITKLAASKYSVNNDVININEQLNCIKQNKLLIYAQILDNTGSVISEINPNRIKNEFKKGILHSNKNLIQESNQILVISSPVKFANNSTGFVVLCFSKAEINSKIISQRNKVVIFGFVFSFLGTLLLFFFIRGLSKPIKLLTEKTKSIAQGNLDQKVFIDTHDELKELSESFNEMTEKLKISRMSFIKAKDSAEKADKLKTEFLAQMSHEIRSPINTILSFASLMRDDLSPQLSDEYGEYFEAIKNAGARITRTIDMILNMSELQSGTYETNYGEFDIVQDVLHELVLEYSGFAAKKGIGLTLIKNSNQTHMYLDRYMVTQIFQNLIDNAVKYSEHGNIEIKVEMNRKKNLVISVSDNGVGISEEFLGNLFEPFRQEEQGYTRRFTGSGLGLALVKKYCELNFADIKVSSKKEIGSTFTVIFNSKAFALKKELSSSL